MNLCFCTDRFGRQIADLLKKPKDGYTSVEKDIYDCIRAKTYNELLDSHDMVRDEKNFRIVKMRLKNSAQRLSSRDGYRLIFLIRKDREEVVLLYAYPKQGNKGQMSVSRDDILTFLNDYINHQKSGTLNSLNLETSS
ncbi:MAG: hypothetical protein LBQ73_04575 [Tannerellaceae bacterium]|jgi:mRNA-degrading endonuclease RelE of RelBE toxin-antitoxin system|nr:hypothetical protein [Tannerellaceae bacterium]